MEPMIPRIRKPVEREGAERYLLFTLLSFGLSVSLTRLFLGLTGYPQLGGGTLHIAHLLWGGLLLFIAALLPILYANRWIYVVSSILSGAGVGLFIDEVGKFITRTNDYFYPPAAPIIYAFFLLTVLLYVEIRRPHRADDRSQMYAVLEDLEEVLDRDLSDQERARILDRLNRIQTRSEYPDFASLVQHLRDFITSDTIYLVPHRPGIIERGQKLYSQIEARLIHRNDLRIFLAILLTLMGAWSLRYPLLVVFGAFSYSSMPLIITELVQSGLVHSQAAIIWFEVRLGLQAAIGLIFLIAAVLYFAGLDRRATGLSYLGLLASLTSVNLLVFYFDQFTTIISAALQFLILVVVVYYRRRFLANRLL